MVAGGAEACICPIALAGFARSVDIVFAVLFISMYLLLLLLLGLSRHAETLLFVSPTIFGTQMGHNRPCPNQPHTLELGVDECSFEVQSTVPG